ncbi:hypothetical protein X975_01643, partial [Stegodyphus mimosarum]
MCVNEDLNRFIYFSVNYAMTFMDLETGAHTNSVEGMWGVIKRDFRKKCHRQYGGYS